jgi:hypothetical protein
MGTALKALIAFAVVATLAIVGTGAYFVVTGQQAASAAAQDEADEAKRTRLAQEKAAGEAREARLEEQSRVDADEAEREATADMVEAVGPDVERSIRAEYRENDTATDSVGCALTGSRTYRCIVEYTDDYLGEMSDLIEAKVSDDGTFVWSEINP